MFHELIDWLNDLPTWFQMLFGSGVSFALVYLVVLAVKRGLKVNRDGVEVGPNGVVKKKSPHADCSNAKDIVYMLNQSVKILTRKMEIKHYHTMRKQMCYAEERTDQGILMLQGVYITLLKKKGIMHVTASDSFNIYRLILFTLKDRVLHEVRMALHGETLAEMDEIDFQSFVEAKIETIITLGSSTLNELYFFAQDTTREELYDANMESISKIKALVRDVYYYARKVSLDAAEEMKELDLAMEKIMTDIMG